ncbi:MAG: EamA/RhaT family transporter [Nocardioidaceae bacterium]|nr:EamA/RhaT family transporter [Nocardioidaceae bacterium]
MTVHPGVRAALAAAVLFGAGTPCAKILLSDVSPVMLAGLLYIGSGAGMTAIRLAKRAPRVRLTADDRLPLAGAIVFGGVLGPVLLLLGLSSMPASGASLLLNAEGVFTALLAWFLFRENVDRRIALGMVAIVAGAAILSVPSGTQFSSVWPALAILAACACWGLDNNLTRKVSLHDATWLVAIKGVVAGLVNLALALVVGAHVPSAGYVGAAMVVGFFAYGVSLVLFIVALRHLGTARAGAYFSAAPFFGALLAIAVGDPLTVPLIIAGLLMAVGIALHLTEKHAHHHTHVALEHEHWHSHDEHHRHEHAESVSAGAWHVHGHVHQPITHAHQHYPDVHHRHH